jgi:hypothetical protein
VCFTRLGKLDQVLDLAVRFEESMERHSPWSRGIRIALRDIPLASHDGRDEVSILTAADAHASSVANMVPDTFPNASSERNLNCAWIIRIFEQCLLCSRFGSCRVLRRSNSG